MQEPRLLYILRIFPELSETFVLREIQGLMRAGRVVSVLAIRPGAHADWLSEHERRTLPPVRYLAAGTAHDRGTPPGESFSESSPRQGPIVRGTRELQPLPSIHNAAPTRRGPGRLTEEREPHREGSSSDSRSSLASPIPGENAGNSLSRGEESSARASRAAVPEVRSDSPDPSDSDRTAPLSPPGPVRESGAMPRTTPGGVSRDASTSHHPGERGGTRALLLHVASDAARLRGHPRRIARALRLAWHARRARALVPSDTARLHAHFANDAATLARYVSALTGIPYRVTAHAYDLFKDPFLLGPNLACADHVYTVTWSNLEFLREQAAAEGWDMRRFSVLRCGIDLAEFAYRDPPPLRRPARLLCVSRLVPKKGHAVLLDAVARALGQGLDLELTLAGDGPLSEEIRARAARNDLSGRVTLLGAISPTRARTLTESSDLSILASRIAEDGDRDGLPITLIEAMAIGVPVVSTEVSGIPELVTPRTGWLAPPDRPELLAAAIRNALEEPQQDRIARARRAREKVESEFDLSLQVESLATP